MNVYLRWNFDSSDFDIGQGLGWSCAWGLCCLIVFKYVQLELMEGKEDRIEYLCCSSKCLADVKVKIVFIVIMSDLFPIYDCSGHTNNLQAETFCMILHLQF